MQIGYGHLTYAAWLDFVRRFPHGDDEKKDIDRMDEMLIDVSESKKQELTVINCYYHCNRKQLSEIEHL